MSDTLDETAQQTAQTSNQSSNETSDLPVERPTSQPLPSIELVPSYSVTRSIQNTPRLRASLSELYRREHLRQRAGRCRRQPTVGRGVHGETGPRNSPTVWNAVFMSTRSGTAAPTR
ncbi:hypothetical protein C9J85_06960 [Haloferax sp. wsp5]|nr:hypothetical protein C9J85_06960 [Haloferax sp. wsp5]